MKTSDLFRQLEQWIEKEQGRGWDPFDGLNSKVFQSFPVIRSSSLARLIWLQFFKRFPINLRKLCAISKHINPKGEALRLSALCAINRSEDVAKIEQLANELLLLQNTGYSGACWGYPFDWQARAFFQPKGTPTVVATSYVACALLDAFVVKEDTRYLSAARSACTFVLRDLNRTYDADGNFAFSYSPLDSTQVFNASLLGARLLIRVWAFTHERELLDAAKKSIAFACYFQRPDGAWSYSPLPFHQWVDSFHTGFNLECIKVYRELTSDTTFDSHLHNGLEYYLGNFFTAEGIPKYYDTSIYPIDMHAPAQLVATLDTFGLLEEQSPLVRRVFNWCVMAMYDKQGFFYFQKTKWGTNKIPYMRWTQDWMYYALAILVKRGIEID